MNILNEALMKTVSQNLADDKLTPVVDPTYADAIRTGKQIETDLAKRFKDQEKAKDEFVKDNHKTERKVKGTKEMKKMKLSEGLFEEVSLEENVREATDKVIELADNGIISWETLAIACLKYMSEDAVADMAKANEFFAEKDSLDEGVAQKPARNLFYKSTREPLADIIQQELTSGEVVYNLNKDGKYIMTWAPSLNLDEYDIGVNGDAKGDYIIAYVPSEDMCTQIEAVASKYGKEFESGFDKYAASDKKYFTKIYVDEADWDEPYFDPNVQIRPDGRKKAA